MTPVFRTDEEMEAIKRLVDDDGKDWSSAAIVWERMFRTGVAMVKVKSYTDRDLAPGVVMSMGAVFDLTMKERKAVYERMQRVAHAERQGA